MSIKVLNAVAGGGKTEWAVIKSREIAVGLAKSPYVLLPSRTQVDDFRQRLAKAGGSMGVYLGTFQNLSREILDRSDMNLIEISETTQLKLVQTIVENLSLHHYQKIKHKPGFAQTVLAIMKELEAGMIRPDIFHHAVQEIGQGGRLEELGLIYQKYRDRLVETNWVDPAGMAWLAVDVLTGNVENNPDWDTLIVDGFDDLSPVQMELIIQLSRVLPEVIITITGTNDGLIRPLVHKRFNHLHTQLKNNSEMEAINLDDEKNGNSFFEKLETILFSTRVENVLEVSKKVRMVAVPDREGEVRTAFRWMKNLISSGEVEHGQVALIMRTLEPYRRIIDKVSREYKLPVLIRGGLPLGENPAVAAILSLLNLTSIGKEGLAWQDVISLWQSPYFDWSQLSDQGDKDDSNRNHSKDVKKLSEIARWGSVIHSYDQWKEAFEHLISIPSNKKRGYGYNSIPGAVPVGDDANRLWEKFEAFVGVISPPEDGLAVEEYLIWIENLLGDLNLEEDRIKGLNLYQMAYAGGPDLFQRDARAIRKLVDVFREYIWSNLMLNSGTTTFRQVLVNLESDIKSKSYQPIPDDEDLIICADCTELRGVYYKAIALIGLAEGEFPGTIKEDPFLRNGDRAVLQERYDFPLRSSTESAEAEFFYEAVIRATDRLLITRPRIADNGAPWQPSPYWEEMLRVTSITPELRTSRIMPELKDAASKSEMFEVIAASDSNNMKEMLREVRVRYPDYFNQVQTAQKVIFTRLGRPGSSDMRYDGSLEHISRNLKARFPEEQVWSPSRLENYQSCPMNFFVNNLLGLEKAEPPQEGLDARQLGNIYHHIMEDIYLEIGDDYDIEGLLSILPDVAQKVFDKAPTREGFRETAWWHHTQREISTNIKHSLIVLEGMDESFRFFRAEQKFGIRNDSAPQLDIEIENQGVYHLRGLIDRVDINDQGDLRIIDYKTSSPFGFDNTAVREGKKLQLPLYALAAQEGLQLGNVKEGFYFHVRSAQPSSFKMSNFWSDGNRGSQAAIENAISKGWEAVTSIQKGIFFAQSPENGCPVYCPAVDFCWHYKRKSW